MVCYIDGGARGNAGPAAIGFVLFDDHGRELHRYGKKIGRCTNNCAEYAALIEVLTFLAGKNPLTIPSRKDETVTIYSDSELMVRQLNGIYRVRDPKLLPLYKRARDISSHFNRVEILHIPRAENRLADSIVNQVLDNRDYSA